MLRRLAPRQTVKLISQTSSMNAAKYSATLFVILVFVAALVLSHRHGSAKVAAPIPNKEGNTVTYLPLGDSYTIGQSVTKNERWPNQLVEKFASSGTKLQITANPSVTGYTSQDLIDRELPLVPKIKPDFVTVLIGVNDYVQGVDSVTFQKNLNYILTSLQKSRPFSKS